MAINEIATVKKREQQREGGGKGEREEMRSRPRGRRPRDKNEEHTEKSARETNKIKNRASAVYIVSNNFTFHLSVSHNPIILETYCIYTLELNSIIAILRSQPMVMFA